MASSKEYRDFILEQLSTLHDISCRPMMGEFLLYHEGVLFGGIYDDRLLIKRVATNEKFKLPQQIPYKNAKPMYFVDNVDDTDLLHEIVLATCEGLKAIVERKHASTKK